MGIIREAFGVTKNEDRVTKYTMTNQNGMKVSIMNLKEWGSCKALSCRIFPRAFCRKPFDPQKLHFEEIQAK